MERDEHNDGRPVDPAQRQQARSAALSVREARTFWQRLRGLMASPLPGEGQGLLFRRCTSVHTCFMRGAIDLVWIDDADRVVGIDACVAPWRARWAPPTARHLVEMAGGGAQRAGVVTGIHLTGLPPI